MVSEMKNPAVRTQHSLKSAKILSKMVSGVLSRVSVYEGVAHGHNECKARKVPHGAVNDGHPE